MDTAEEFGLSYEACFFLYQDSKRTGKLLRRYALHYSAKKMKAAGLSTHKIAKTLGLADSYIYHLLKTPIPMDL